MLLSIPRALAGTPATRLISLRIISSAFFSSSPHPLRRTAAAAMVKLVVATTADPASVGPASAFLTMPGWNPGPSISEGMESFANGDVRLLKHGKKIVTEDDLDLRWEAATGEPVSEVIFLSRHTAVSNRPALTVHPIGVPHLREDEIPPQGGRPGWASLPNPRIGPWLRLLQKIAHSKGLVPEFEVTLEATHHGPIVHTPTMFLEIGSTEEYWGRQDAAQAMALLLWEGFGLGGGDGVGEWNGKDGVWVGHLLSGYALPMEDPKQQNIKSSDQTVGGTWKQSIKASYEATRAAFPGGEILAHLDQKSFKGWQKNAITSFLAEQKIKTGKPQDFF
uniref:D-aminoacyl-tRNA deacylase isoform X2 n=1 Tax=Elaeis guineensis var. tenera TaxID=51953 RepID=A0A6I9RN21_ELAGV|nr:D-aminoacyl-tRNA deacylase isoform X2 [Elaeis guineensis]